MSDDLLRGTGRSVAKMFHAVANAIESPGCWVPFCDHQPMSKAAARDFSKVIEQLVERQHLKIDVRRRGKRVFLKSTIPRGIRRRVVEIPFSAGPSMSFVYSMR